MLYGHLIIYESIAGGQLGKARRQLGLGLPAQGLDLARSRRPHVLQALLLTRHSLQDPPATSLKKQPCSSVRHDIRHRHAHSLDRVHAYADAPAPETFPERHLPYFGVHKYLSRCLGHQYPISSKKSRMSGASFGLLQMYEPWSSPGMMTGRPEGIFSPIRSVCS